MPNIADITYCRILPGIGIARVGNSPSEFFIGPETPGAASDPPGGFKDAAGRVKRQAARFRVYGYDAADKVVQELTAADADISWTVHLANRKAAWFEFGGFDAEHAAATGGPPLPLRNAGIQNTGGDPKARDVLVIDSGPRTITGPNQASDAYRFDDGHFLGKQVPLGEVRTEGDGRLIVLGGFGTSESLKGDNPILDYANNDSWHDDTSDGPVTAKVVLKGGAEIPVRKSSWVIVAPPDFAPALDNVVSLYEVAEEVAVNAKWIAPPAALSFTRDIYPMLRRFAGLQWVNASANRGHGPTKPGNFTDPDILEGLADKSAAAQPARQAVFNRLRNPAPASDAEAKSQASLLYMPQLSGDEGFTTQGEPSTWFTVLRPQYEKLRRWAAGDFEADWTGSPGPVTPLLSLDVKDQPAALDRAALEHCVGGPFFPGIEMTYISRDPSIYDEPFRLRQDLQPGDVTKRMAVPWQADFYECRTRWWPAQRPDDTVTEAEYDAVLAAFQAEVERSTGSDCASLVYDREDWARGVGSDVKYTGDALQKIKDAETLGDNDLVDKWSRLAFVTARQLPDGSAVMVESGREKYYGLRDRDYFNIMLNLDQFPDFLPTARQLADRFINAAARLQDSPDIEDETRFFEYSPRAFNARLDQIYNDLVASAQSYNPASSDNMFKTREDMVERIRQFAPFNQLDGAWLRNVTQAGPIDEVHALLFDVWVDEQGNGVPELNHANLYTDLLHSVGVYLEDINTQAYAFDPNMLDSAYTLPLMELVISQFSQQYFPEILGLTLQLEWEVVELKTTIALFEYFGLNPQFYRMHVGIDNAISGHGAKAKRAVEIYLDKVRAESGEEELQRQWRRIWNGYVCFRTTGNLGQDLADKLGHPASLTSQVLDMIQRKQPFGAMNHGSKRLGPNLINDWFDDPAGFLQELVTSGMLVPGDPDGSPFFNLLRFSGPMYKIFTDDEIKLWTDWTRSAQATVPAQPDQSDAGQAMVKLVDTLRDRAQGNAGHLTNQLTGPDPSNPGQPVTLTVDAWFQQPTTAFMQAIANEANGWVKKGNAASSRFIAELMSGAHPMAVALQGVAPGSAHKTWRSIAIDWVNSGCPIPAPTASHHFVAAAAAMSPRLGGIRTLQAGSGQPAVPRLRLVSPRTDIVGARRRILGNGAVH